jgi:hypothetical protein
MQDCTLLFQRVPKRLLEVTQDCLYDATRAQVTSSTIFADCAGADKDYAATQSANDDTHSTALDIADEFVDGAFILIQACVYQAFDSLIMSEPHANVLRLFAAFV